MNRFSALLVLILTVCFALSPLASDGFNGFTRDQFPVVQAFWPVQPAGWAFSIWGLIYLWLIAGAGFGLWQRAQAPDWQAMRPALIVSLLIGTFWIAAANYSPLLATAMILVMWAAAVAAWLRAGHQDALWQLRPLGLYAGWLTAASGVAAGAVLSGYGILSAQAAALVCLSLVGLAGLMLQQRRPQEWAYPAAIIWALIGVIAANLPRENWPVIALAALGIALLVWRGLAAQKPESRAIYTAGR
ncbi:MAG: hypothetical protein Q4G24_02825 [Paracoccus sp. (in: a-proteobacteria)]|uniref:hypothetical protein n=1 Tax=Paracoccus sp. TaxID=267 RepID=UPI0026DF4C07|nr:hypothetical protein [Paracoccus sp. (in: a-proteobacteria)]MDO5620384.1 hypothetical protein [Paracoccus sp. (in: a-proteobacteria)]